jgi:hypothetical protein
LRQINPGDAGLQDEEEAREDFTVVEERATPLGMGRMRREKRLNLIPEFVREQGFSHGEPLLKGDARNTYPIVLYRQVKEREGLF